MSATSIGRWLAALTCASLAACGGGASNDVSSSVTSSASDVQGAGIDVTEQRPVDDGVAPYAEVRASAFALTGASSGALVAYDFEDGFSTVAPGWRLNYWGTTARFDASRASTAYTGSGSQRFRVLAQDATSGVHLIHPYAFRAGRRYKAVLHVRSDVSARVTVQLRRDIHPWNAFAAKTIDVGPSWQRVEVEGTYSWSDMGSLRVISHTLGAHVYVDDAALYDTTAESATGSNAVSLPAAGGTAVDLITVDSTDMEGTYTNHLAPGMRINTWGTPLATFDVAKETRSTHVYSGSASQRFRVMSRSTGDAHLVRPFPFVKGKTYRATVMVRADEPTTVQVFMRRDIHPWDAFASKTVTVSTGWQKVEIQGAYIGDVTGSLRVAIRELGRNVWVDDVRIYEVERNEMAPVTTAPVADSLFGLHINKLGVHWNWPALGQRIVRLWNTGTSWKDIETSQNNWNFSTGGGLRLDHYVRHVTTKDPSATLLYTLGVTPRWASASPNAEGSMGVGTSGAPANLEDWRDYVRTIARRYAGKIKYYELWNEVDYLKHYVGSVETMVEMARIAREEIKAADPGAWLLTPSFTSSGIAWLDNFLAKGGKDHVDAVAFHWYFGYHPELMASAIDNVRQVMANHGLGNKPLWNTEGATWCNQVLENCGVSSFVPTEADKRSVMARAWLVMWSRGVSNFNYHTWEGLDPNSALVQSDFTTATSTGSGYREAVSWIRGAQLIDAFKVGADIYVFRLQRGTSISVVMWSTGGSKSVLVPSSWAVNTVKRLSGTESAFPGDRVVTLGIEPILLKP